MTSTLVVTPVAFLFGLCFGSFLNVCIYRLPRRCLSISEPRGSFCPSCRAAIAWYHNLPVVSWILLRGRCASCGLTIRWRYPFVELLTGVMFALTAWIRLVLDPTPPPLPWSVYAALAFDLYLVAGVITLSYVDLDLHIIPDEISLPAIPIGLLAGALAPTPILLESVDWFAPLAAIGSPHLRGLAAAALGGLAGGGGLWLMGWAGTMLLRRPAMGMGDVKIMAGFGAFIGWEGSLFAILLASFAGAMLSGLRFLSSGSHSLAFGPYLAIGALVVRVADVRIYELGVAAAAWSVVPGNLPVLWGVLGLLTVYLVSVLIVLRRDRRRMSQELEEL